MNRKRQGRRKKNEKRIETKVTRCGLLKRPVFEHEVCSEFIAKTNVDSAAQENCKNCKYSF